MAVSEPTGEVKGLVLTHVDDILVLKLMREAYCAIKHEVAWFGDTMRWAATPLRVLRARWRERMPPETCREANRRLPPMHEGCFGKDWATENKEDRHGRAPHS